MLTITSGCIAGKLFKDTQEGAMCPTLRWLWLKTADFDTWMVDFSKLLFFPLIPNAYMAIANDFSQQLVYLVEKDHTKTMSWKSHKSFSRGPFSHWL